MTVYNLPGSVDVTLAHVAGVVQVGGFEDAEYDSGCVNGKQTRELAIGLTTEGAVEGLFDAIERAVHAWAHDHRHAIVFADGIDIACAPKAEGAGTASLSRAPVLNHSEGERHD